MDVKVFRQKTVATLRVCTTAEGSDYGTQFYIRGNMVRYN